MSAWSAAYLAEDAAEAACRTAAAALSNPLRRRALVRAADHAAARTRIQSLLTDLPAVPAAYSFAESAGTPAAARALVSRTENALVPVYADAAAADAGPSRAWAVEQAMACAVAGVRWGGATQAFPQAPSSTAPEEQVPGQTQDQ